MNTSSSSSRPAYKGWFTALTVAAVVWLLAAVLSALNEAKFLTTLLLCSWAVSGSLLGLSNSIRKWVWSFRKSEELDDLEKLSNELLFEKVDIDRKYLVAFGVSCFYMALALYFASAQDKSMMLALLLAVMMVISACVAGRILLDSANRVSSDMRDSKQR